MEKYHIGRNGAPSRCTAEVNCPLGDESEHFSSIEEAQEYADSINEEQELVEKDKRVILENLSLLDKLPRRHRLRVKKIAEFIKKALTKVKNLTQSRILNLLSFRILNTTLSSKLLQKEYEKTKERIEKEEKKETARRKSNEEETIKETKEYNTNKVIEVSSNIEKRMLSGENLKNTYLYLEYLKNKEELTPEEEEFVNSLEKDKNINGNLLEETTNKELTLLRQEETVENNFKTTQEEFLNLKNENAFQTSEEEIEYFNELKKEYFKYILSNERDETWEEFVAGYSVILKV